MALPEELRDAVAVIGMALRFPGASSLEQYWRNLAEGVESITSFSPEDLKESVDSGTLRDPCFVPAFGRVDGHDLFDAGFFRFTPRDARQTDPQLRLLLTCSWEALEDAGYGVAEQDCPVGVFVGAAESYYPGHNRTHSAGGLLEFLATQISYKLNLKGPSLSLQTACSTSLVCIHMAMRSLLDGECDMALAGASSICLPQARGHLYREGGNLSPDGHCRPFDRRAQGAVPGNGVGAVVLKRMDDAWQDGDPIRAVIRGSAINNNGRDSNDYWMPSVEGQAQVIDEALALARVDAETISYIETHGTATPLADAVEIQALNEVFGNNSDRSDRCALGSVKGNLGHLNTAAGMAGLIKTVLALEHRQLPSSLHFESPHPDVPLEGGPFYVNDQLRPWKTDGPRRAGVSAFGIGGTNAHLILEETPASAPSASSEGPNLLVLSARSETALEAATEHLADHLRAHPELDLADVAHTLRVGRRHWPHRWMAVCRSTEDAALRLVERDTTAIRSLSNAAPEVVFLFPGQGAQHVGLGRQLYSREPVFREEFDRCCDLLKPHVGRDPRDLFHPDDAPPEVAGGFSELDVAQPTLLAFEIALAKTWMAKGIQPAALIGHGLGEYAAAHLAGVFSPEDVLGVAAARAKLTHGLPADVTLEAALEPFARHLATLDLGAPEMPVISTLTGGVLTAAEASDPDYWCRQLGDTSSFDDGIRRLDEGAERVFLEIGPGHDLTASISEWIDDPHRAIPSLGSADDEHAEDLSTAVGRLWLAGVPLDWARINSDEASRRRLSLPATPLEVKRYRPPRVVQRTAPGTRKAAPAAPRQAEVPSPTTEPAAPATPPQPAETLPSTVAPTPPSPTPATAAASIEAAPPMSPLEAVLNDQLQLMMRQLELLGSRAGTPLTIPGSPEVAVTELAPPQIAAASDVATSDAAVAESPSEAAGSPAETPDARGFEIPAEVAATHRDLSLTSYRFLEYVLENPAERGRHLDHRAAGADLEDWIQRVSFELQSWPTFIGHRKRDQVSQAALSVISLVRGIYERVFDNDPVRIAEFHEFENPHAAEFLTSAPNGLDNCLVRCDFSDSQRGLKCLEVNASGSISGWQHLFWEKILRHQPVIADFIEREGIEPAYHDVLRAFLTHVVEDCRGRDLLEADHLNLAMANERRAIHVTRQAAPRLNRLAEERLRPMGLTGTIFVCTMADLEVRDGKVFHGSERIHAIHQTDFEPSGSHGTVPAAGSSSSSSASTQRLAGASVCAAPWKPSSRAKRATSASLIVTSLVTSCPER